MNIYILDAMKRLFVMLSIAMSVTLAMAQAHNSETIFRVQGGYAFASGQKDAALDDGTTFKLTWDERVSDSKVWFLGFGTQYLRTSLLDLPIVKDVPFDVYAFVVRTGWQHRIFCDNLSIWCAFEGGAGLMQSRHQYDGARYRLKRGTAVGGFEIGLDYRLTDTFGLSLAWNATRFGNDNLQHGAAPVALPKASIFSTSALNVGFSITLK